MNKLYNVTTTAKITGVHPQTLRHYESIGLVIPKRTLGNVRRYSDWDIERLLKVRSLANRGINLEGIAIIMRQEEEINILQRQLLVNKADNIFTAGSEGTVDIVQYQKMSLIDRIRFFRRAHKLRHNMLQIEGPKSDTE
jgi:MerR family transcriptional regulator/heat shock protein HspR